MKVTSSIPGRLGLLGLVSLLSASHGLQAAVNPAPAQWIPATAKASGAGGEQFVSSLRIHNPNGVAAQVTVSYFAQSPIDGSGQALGDNSSPQSFVVTVPAGQTAAVEDVLSRFTTLAPHGIGAGGLRIDSVTTTQPQTPLPVSVLSRTFVANGRSATGAPGTYGFSIPSQTADEGVVPGDVATISYTSAAPTLSAGFRSNLLLLNGNAPRNAAGNPEPQNSVVNVKLLRGDGTTVGEKDYTLGKYSAAQLSNVGSAFGATAEDTNLLLQITVKSGGPVFTGLSIIDNAISSLNYAPPTKSWKANYGAYGLIIQDGEFGFSGRLDVFAGKPDYLSAGIVVRCPAAGSQPKLYFFQAASANTTFTSRADGSYAFQGTEGGATWSGTVFFGLDGTVFGTITHTPAASENCGGTSTYAYTGARGAILLP